jgi:hypothetical protein
MKNSKLLLLALLNSLGASVYIAAVVLLMTNAQKFFGQANNFLGSAAILLLFVISATIVGLLVLGRPGHLYFNGFKKEGIVLLLYTIAFLFVIIVAVLLTSVLLK